MIVLKKLAVHYMLVSLIFLNSYWHVLLTDNAKEISTFVINVTKLCLLE